MVDGRVYERGSRFGTFLRWGYHDMIDQPAAPEHLPESPETSTTGRAGLLLLWACAIVTTAAWIPIYRWFGLFENEHNTHFAFEKIPGYFDSPIMRRTLALFILIGLLYGFAIWLIRSIPSFTLPAKLGIATLILGPVIANVCLYPVGALDVFNYMIELKLTYFFDQNPYLVTFEAYRSDSFSLPAFLVDIRLFYGPAWLLLSWVPTAITGFDDVLTTLIGLKFFNVILLAIAAWLIARYQDDRRRGWIAATIFLANPLVLFEGIANVHNDVMMTTLLVGAFYALAKRSPFAGPLLALSALVKFNPLVLAPLMIAVVIRERWEWRRLLATTAMSVVAVVAVCLPWWGEGEFIDGVTSGLESSQQMDHVSISSLTRQWFQDREAERASPAQANFIRASLSFNVVPEQTRERLDRSFAVAIAIITVLIAISVWRGAPPEPAGAATLLVLILLGTNFYAWYLIPVFALIALRVDRVSLIYAGIATTAALAYYPMYVYAHFTSGWHRFRIHQFLAVFLTVPALLFAAINVSRTLAAGRPGPRSTQRSPADPPEEHGQSGRSSLS